MFDESNYINDYHGLELHPGFNPGTRDNENGILFLVEFYVLKYMLGIMTYADVAQFQIIVENITTCDANGNKIKGLYDRGAGESLRIPSEQRRSISHDNITAISLFSQLVDLKYRTDIADMLIKSKSKFDNKHPDNQTWDNPKIHPRDWFVWLNCSEKKWHRICSWVWFPVYMLAALEDCLSIIKCRPVWYERLWKKLKGEDPGNKRCFLDTSGPLLWFIRHEVMSRKNLLCKALYWICKQKYRKTFGRNWINGAMEIYFENSEHPNKVLSRKLK